MIDATTDQPLRVSKEGNAGPYIMVPVLQLENVKGVLEANKVSYWVDEEAISLDGKPEIIIINLGLRTDAATVQRLLDGIP
ncbi:MAG TPA: hypothetical protein VND64_07205 [Pirellulales bacterium]|nr:hypothetical protein [Pirellulales bacterium]